MVSLRKMQSKRSRIITASVASVILIICCASYIKHTWTLRNIPDSKCVSMGAVLSIKPSVERLVTQSQIIVDAEYHKSVDGKPYLSVKKVIKGAKYLNNKDELSICPGYEYLRDGQAVMAFFDGLDKGTRKWMPLQGDIGITVQNSRGSYDLNVTDKKKTYTTQEIIHFVDKP